jgi:hypothetical protein
MDNCPPDALPLNAAISRWVPAAAQKEEADALRNLFLRGEVTRRVDEASGLASVVIDFNSPTETNSRLLRKLREAQLRAEAELVAMLRAGRLVAWGRVGSPLAPMVQLPADAWGTLQLTNIQSGEARGGGVAVFGLRVAEPPAASAEPVAPAAPAEPVAALARRCNLPPQDLVRLAVDDARLRREAEAVNVAALAAPPVPPAAAVAREAVPLVYSEAALRAWYRLRVATWSAERVPPSEADDLAAATEHFRVRVPRNHLRAARRELAPEGWRKSGPRKPRE